LERELLAEGRLPECWIPPAHILECRALLETYHELREEHTGWLQRIHAVLFHQGAPSLAGSLDTDKGRAQLAEIAAGQLSPVGRMQVATALNMLEVIDVQLEQLRTRIRAAARGIPAARLLTEQLYGVGPMSALALTCWLGGAGRFSSTRKAVRFAGLDITVYSSNSKRAPGHLSRQGPSVLRWAIYEAGKAHARGSAPDHAYYAEVQDRIDGKRAALSEARKIIRKAVHILDQAGDQALAVP
jgi:transposase